MAVEEAGFDYLGVPEHILGADSVTRPGWKGPYDTDDPFHEIFVLFGYLAAFTHLELVPCVLVLPLRQTALVAKQAAAIDVLTGGRLRLGVASGWNQPEFQGLGIDFRTRGARVDEQIEVLRLLWTEKVVTFEGKFHTLDRVGINPFPVQRPIPLWIGGGVQHMPANETTIRSRIIERIARTGDGWISGPTDPVEHVAQQYEVICDRAKEYGRNPATIGLQASVRVSRPDQLDDAAERIDALRAAGTTHFTLETRRAGLSLDEHVEMIGKLGELIADKR